MNKKKRKRIIKIRTISKDEAKIEIEALFQKHTTLFYSDIAKKLKLDLEFVVTVCEELVDENILKFDVECSEIVDGIFTKSLTGTPLLDYRYWCTKCEKIHTNTSRIYKDHKAYQK